MKTPAVLIVTLTSMGLALAPRARADEPVSDEVRAYFKNGVELLEAENYQDAYYQLKLAYERSNNWKILGNWGLAALKLERDEEALRFYERYLALGGSQIARVEREAIERDMLLIRGNTATIELHSAHAFELVASRRGSTAAPQTYAFGAGEHTLLLRAGTQHLTAQRADGRTVAWDVMLTPGRQLERTLAFDEPEVGNRTAEPPSRGKAVAPPARKDAVSEESGAQSPALLVTGLVTAGVGVAAVGAGVWFGLRAESKEEDALGPCDRTTKICTEDRREDFDEADQSAGRANMLFIVGGGLTALGAALAIYGGLPSGAGREQSARVEWAPFWTPGAGGLVASGAF